MTAVVLRADARRLPLPDGCVDLVVTSPPYFGLRSYTDGGAHYAGQIGSEATPAEWLANLVECTREWVRVLKPSGSIFVNLGDKYCSGTSTPRSNISAPPGYGNGKNFSPTDRRLSADEAGVPVKSLLGLPWRYALACMDELGLILRRDIIWSKPNGLPESVTDRCRSSHEFVFHLVKRPRYYAAVDEIREGYSQAPDAVHHRRYGIATNTRHPSENHNSALRDRAQTGRAGGYENPLGKLPGSVWSIPSQPLVVPAHLGVDHFAAFPLELPRRIIAGWSPPGVCTECGEGRRPVADSLRAGSEQKAVKRLEAANGAITGGTRRSTLSDVKGAPSAVITGYACACTPYTDHPGTGETAQRRDYSPGPRDNNAQGTYGRHQAGEYERVGPRREYHLEDWQPPPTHPAIVLDPFAGTGTTLLAAAALGRIGVGVDRSADYCRLAAWRTQDRGEIAKAMLVPKPPPVPDGQESLFEVTG